MPVPTFRSGGVVVPTPATGATLSMNTPSAMAVGDFLVVAHFYDYNALADLTTPTGTAVTTWASQTTSGTTANQMHLKLWSGTATAAGVQTVVVNTATSDATHMPVLFVVDATGVTIAVVDVAQNTGNNTVSHVAPSITTTPLIDDRLICGAGESPFSGGAYSWPGSMTEQSDVVVGSNSVASTATEVLTANGSTGTRTATFSGTTEDFVAFSIVLRATTVGGGTPLPPALRRVRTAIT